MDKHSKCSCKSKKQKNSLPSDDCKCGGAEKNAGNNQWCSNNNLGYNQ